MSGTLAKALFNAGVTTFQLLQLRTTIAAAGLLLIMLSGFRRDLGIRRDDLPVFLIIGLALALSQLGYFIAISRIQVAAAILLQYQAPVLIALHAVVFAGRRLSGLTISAIAAAMAGCYLMAGGLSQNIFMLDRVGVAAGLGSAFSFTVYAVKSEKIMTRYRPLTIVFYAFLFTAFFWNIMLPPLGSFRVGYKGASWLKIGYIGIFGTIAPFALYSEGIRRIGAPHTSVTSTLEPVIAGVLSFYFLGEGLGPIQLAGAALIIFAVIMLQVRGS